MGSTVFAVALALALASCAIDRTTAKVDVPDRLAAGPDASLAIVAAAKGVQVYQCRVTSGSQGAYAWQLVAPEAELFDVRGEKIGRHFAGPAWESRDGSRIVGTVRERAEAPSVDAIPWLLLAAKTAGPDGALSKVTAVQRINTVGGVAPHEGCTRAAEGTMLRVPYTAEYRFFNPRTTQAVYSSY